MRQDLTLDLGDHAIHVRIDGPASAPALLLAHPLGGSVDSWGPQMPALAGRFRVIRYDARGHGASTAPDGPLTVDQLGQDAVAVLDAVGAGRAHACGLSMGGQLALWLAIRHPARVERLAVANSGAAIGDAEIWNGRIAGVMADGMGPAADAAIARWFTAPFVAAHGDIVEAVRAQVAAMNPMGYAACCAALRDTDLTGGLAGVTQPTLVIVGRQDVATPPQLGLKIAQGVTGARAVTLDGGHLSNIECADAFNAALAGFLTG